MTDYKSMGDRDLLGAIVATEREVEAQTRLLRQAKEELLHRKRNGIAQAYAAKESQFGVVHLEEGEYTLDITTTQRVEWDQDRLAEMEKQIRDEWLADPAEYIEKKLSVKESKYKAWPADLRANFESARTVKASAPSLSITPKDEE